jgi:hypothetical protein
MKRFVIIAASTLVLIACGRRQSGGMGGGPPQVRSAMEACGRFEAAHAVSGCREESVQPALTPGAKQRVVFTLPSGKKGQVFSFTDKNAYDKSAKNIEGLEAAGQQRWGNRDRGIYVQLNKDVSDDEARKVKDVLDMF